MKRIIVGMLLAVVAWMIGTLFQPWYAKWLGLVFGFISGLVFEDWKMTKEIVARKWRECVNYKLDWKGAAIYVAANFCLIGCWTSWLIAIFLFAVIDKFPEYQGTLYVLYSWLWVFSTVAGTIVWSLVPVENSLFLLRRHHLAGVLKYDAEEWMKTSLRLNVVSVCCFCCFWPLYHIIHDTVPSIFRCVKNAPRLVRTAGRGLNRFGQFLLYSLLELVAREKTLTFAICVTAGAGMGMMMGKTIVCGLSASVLAGALILVSDWTRELAKQKLEALEQST